MVEIAILSIFAGQTRPIRKSGWLKIFPGAFMNPTADAQFLFQPNNTFLFAHYGAMFFIADHDCPYHEAPSGSINRFHRPPPRPHPGFGHGHGGFGHGHGGFGHGHGGFGHGGHGHGHFHFGNKFFTPQSHNFFSSLFSLGLSSLEERSIAVCATQTAMVATF
ncbi:hypothetical protein Y032_0071g558 [Ancylostoma ceylanicum]|uniref:Uncharacterized protein n=1 Tax=Ancylostoma ceylanicum TaxID=53326 RepID=A0A016TXB9_9BILA|nr:hypothetical protein Y032_0071g558 [Ancylostoma ceylanicum]